jgi:hypothetical protein
MKQKQKLICKSSFRTKNSNGEPCKTYFWTFSDGVVVIDQLFLLNKEVDNKSLSFMCKRFGKFLYAKSMSFKYGSLQGIFISVTKILKDKGVKQEDLLT